MCLAFLASIVLSTTAPTFACAEEKAPVLPKPADRKIDFRKDIAPIFARSCHACHGAKKQESGFRLDLKDAALAGGDSGPSFDVGKSAESDLVTRIAGIDPDLVMPPEDETPLSAKEVGLIRAWIDQGAVWPDGVGPKGAVRSDHWSFQPIRNPAAPTVKNEEWVRNPIDAFVLARLETEGAGPSAEADRPTLIRRLSLDLLGLPPTLQQIDQFVADKSPDAYGRLVDRLLESKHFGERWGRHWLDLARYADSDGYEKDRPRPWAWRYRNWVIDAINADMPFDQFTIEQLAGDLLPEATLDQRVATGFHRNTLTNTEGGTDKEEDRVKRNVDRTNTTGQVWLGLTIGCAQCHSHKYDPISQREYYGMFAFFDRAKESNISAPLPAETAAYEKALAKFESEHAPLTASVAEHEPKLAALQTAWEATLSKDDRLVGWTPLEPVGFVSDGGAGFKRLPDGSLLIEGTKPGKDVYTVVVNTDLTNITAIRLEAIPEANLPKKGPGRSDGGNFVLSEVTLTLAPRGEPQKAAPVTLEEATADFSQKDFPVTGAVDGKDDTGWAIGASSGDSDQRRTAIFRTKEAVGATAGSTLNFKLKQLHGSEHTLGRFRLSATTASRARIPNLLPDDVLKVLAATPDQRGDESKKSLAAYYRTVEPEMVKRVAAVTEHAKSKPTAPPTMSQAIVENPKPPTTHVMIRGDFLQKGAEVTSATPAVLNEAPAEGTGDRLKLARWILDPANPLTRRVAVNRIWQHLFGTGLVVTTEDFGSQGDKPSHPELLDSLATEFLKRGWSTKAMIRFIVDSATYRQSAATRADLAERDPKNRLLARQNRFRLESEILRDAYLASSGLLHPAIGGPSVRPALPAGIASLGYANSVKWKTSDAPDRYRRGMYIFYQRTVPYPMLATFDTPDSNVTCTRRTRSNTPLQSLTLLNDPVFFECAQSLGRRILEERKSADVSERLRHGFRLCLARDPNADELATLADLYHDQISLCRSNVKDAAALVGDRKPAGVDDAEAAAWVLIGRILLNLDEFLTRE